MLRGPDAVLSSEMWQNQSKFKLGNIATKKNLKTLTRLKKQSQSIIIARVFSERELGQRQQTDGEAVLFSRHLSDRSKRLPLFRFNGL